MVFWYYRTIEAPVLLTTLGIRNVINIFQNRSIIVHGHVTTLVSSTCNTDLGAHH